MKLHFKKSKNLDNKNNYKELLSNFLKLNQITLQQYGNDYEWRYRYFCYRYLVDIRFLKMPKQNIDSFGESVLIEFEKPIHLEFVIRNALDKLGAKWKYTIACCEDNYEFINKINDSISTEFNIIKVDTKDKNKLLKSKDFWDKLTGKKILFYGNDSVFFVKEGFKNYFKWNFICAPIYNNSQNELILGGPSLSMRTKDIILKVIDKVPVNENECETQYFLRGIRELKLCDLPPNDIANSFCSKSNFVDGCFAGDKFWNSNQIVNVEYHMTNKIIDPIKSNNDFKKFYEAPLFHKYALGISIPDAPIRYEIIKEGTTLNDNKLYSHLHCYDITEFNTIYNNYLPLIKKYFNIIVTYSKGEAVINESITLLKIPNRGLDIGAKFCAVAYLIKEGKEYDYILFLHSKTDVIRRTKYFESLISNLNDEFINNINKHDAYFPDEEFVVCKERNLIYRNGLLNYMKAKNDCNTFIEGNVYLLSKNIVDILFTDPLIYNMLNRPNDFDGNWARITYNLKGNAKEMYTEFKKSRLAPRYERGDPNEGLSRDAYFENAFEQIILNFCNNPMKMKERVKQPVVKQPVVKQPVVKQPVVKQPVVKQPVVKQPVVKQPVVKQPLVKQPNKSCKFTIIMNYFNRKEQIIYTLKQINKLYSEKYNVEIIIVDDNSSDDQTLYDYIDSEENKLQIKYLYLSEKEWINPVVSMNVAINHISSDTEYVILQNSEIFHCGNIIEHVYNNSNDKNYLVYPVYNSKSFDENNIIYDLFNNECNNNDYYVKLQLDSKKKANDWYQHKIYHNRNYNFLTAIKKITLDKIGGFCNEMKDGLWYDDDDFLNRIGKICNITSVLSDKYFGIHQKHNSYTMNIDKDTQNTLKNKNKEIFERNKAQNIIYLDPSVENLNLKLKYHIPADNFKKISIVMAYYNRKQQTIKTLKGFEKMYAGNYNFEVVIVDDNSNDENRLEEDIKQFSFPINLIVISAEEKGDRINPCIAYNKGFAEATGEIIIIQNPECYHVGDILKHTLENLDEQDYFSYSCFTANSPEISQEMIKSENVFELIKKQEFLDKNVTDKSTLMNWYNHPTDTAHGGRNTAYHFCNTIYKSKLDLIGGFDKRFADGYCFDDDELLLAVKYNLKLDIKIIKPEKCFVIHQYHTRNVSSCCNKEEDNHSIKSKWLKNKQLFEKIKNNHLRNDFVYPKLLFLYWDGSPLSYLNYLTVVSFNKYNPDWKIIIYMPYKKTTIINWKSHEQKLRYTGTDYMYKLYDIDNVIIKKICLNDIGFDNEASEVIKSDYFRYYILEKHGGLWSDFDIIYTGSIEEKMNFNENSIIFKTYVSTGINKGYYVYPIGLFLSKPNSLFFKMIKNKTHEYYDKHEYQSIGAVMFDKIFKKKKFIDGIRICNYEYYLPWAWNELDQFLDKNYINNVLPNNNIGLHWFNGADRTKKYAIDLDSRIKEFKINCFLDKLIYKYINYNGIVQDLLDNKIYTHQDIITRYGFNIMETFIEKNYIKVKESDNTYSNTKIYNLPKILFTYWDKPNISFLHYMCIYTLRKFHPDYKIKIFINKNRIYGKTWTTNEQKLNTHQIDNYFYNLYELDVEIIPIDFFNCDVIPFYLPEVIKSDLFRLKFICENGGIWIDFDTFWISNVETIFKLMNNNITYKRTFSEFDKTLLFTETNDDNCFGIRKELNQYFILSDINKIVPELQGVHFAQYLVFGNNKSEILHSLFKSALDNLDISNYQSVGTTLFNKFLIPFFNEKIKKNELISDYFIDQNTVCPFRYYETDKLFELNIDFKEKFNHTACIHWFNGCSRSQTFINKFNHKNFDNFPDNTFTNIFHTYLTNEDKHLLSNIRLKKKISIVMAYFNREKQLKMTLESIKKSKYLNKEIIIVDDNSRPDQRVELFIDNYRNDLDIKVITIKESEKNWVNPCIPYNKGIKIASGDIIVLQNPEVMHVGDCLSFINDNLDEKDWLSFNCYGSPNFEFNEKLKNKTSNEIFNNIYNINFNIGGNSVARDDVGGWLNHYEKHFVAYHYLVAIHKSDINNYLGGGFNNKFKDGIGADDDELIKRLIYYKFNFKTTKFENGQPFCVHLFHEKPKQLKNLDWRDNKKIFIESCINMNMFPENNIALAPKNETPMSRQVLIE